MHSAGEHLVLLLLHVLGTHGVQLLLPSLQRSFTAAQVLANQGPIGGAFCQVEAQLSASALQLAHCSRACQVCLGARSLRMLPLSRMNQHLAVCRLLSSMSCPQCELRSVGAEEHLCQLCLQLADAALLLKLAVHHTLVPLHGLLLLLHEGG